MSTRYVFVGERPSDPARRRGYNWRNGHVAAKTLRAALEAAGVEPQPQVYLNLWPDDPGQAEPRDGLLVAVAELATAGLAVIGMGEKVCAALRRARVPHTHMIHPAARGSIRSTPRYQAHVAAALRLAVQKGARP